MNLTYLDEHLWVVALLLGQSWNTLFIIVTMMRKLLSKYKIENNGGNREWIHDQIEWYI